MVRTPENWQQLTQGLPDFLRTDAHVYNDPKRAYQQLMTLAAGKYEAAKDMTHMAQDQASSSRSSTSGTSRRPIILKPWKAPDPWPLQTMDSRCPTTVLQRPVDKDCNKIDPGKTYGFRAPASQFIGARTIDSCRPFCCYLCLDMGLMAHDCPTLIETQRKIILTARDNFHRATRGWSQSTEVHPTAHREFQRTTRIALVQALRQGVNLSDDEADREESEKDGRKESEPSEHY